MAEGFRGRPEHVSIIFQCVMFFLLYKITDGGVFDDFPKISDHFPKISEDFPKLFLRPDVRSQTFSENFGKLPKAFEEDPNMFRSYTNEFKCNSTDKLDISEIIDIFPSKDMENKPLESRM